jgi:hypothetical protein
VYLLLQTLLRKALPLLDAVLQLGRFLVVHAQSVTERHCGRGGGRRRTL